MRIILFASIILFVLSGVATADDFQPNRPNRCNGIGLTHVKIQYGDGKFIVDAVVHSRPTGELRFQLFPDRDSELGVDYTTVKVEVDAKDQTFDWFEGSNEKMPHYFSVCVPSNQKTGEHIMYSVKFTNPDTEKEIGLVDPKVIIEEDD